MMSLTIQAQVSGRLRAVTCCCLLLLSTLVLVQPHAGATPIALRADEEIIKEFKKYFRKFKDTATRVEAIYSLEDADTPEVVMVLAPVLADKDSEVVDAAVKTLASFKARPTIDAVFFRLAKEKQESIRLGLIRAIAEGGYSGDPEVLAGCLTDRSWLIRFRAIQALEARGGLNSIPALIELTGDKEPAVRCAALLALATMREDRGIDLAIAALDDPVWQVRASAASSLYSMRALRSIDPLITQMETEQGRLLEDYARALEEITAKRFGLRAELWRKWWTGIKERFVIPTDEELAAAKAKRDENRARYSPPGSTSYHGIETPSRSVVFIIDVSGSMENHVIEKDRFEGRDLQSMSKIDIAKGELQRTIEGLEPYVKLNIFTFATEVKSWEKKLVTCNPLNRRSAIDWVGNLKAIGGNSKERLARVGLTGAANLEAGKTNTFGALMRALGVAGRGAREDGYEVMVDTIFFLSDGRPTVGDLIDPADILAEVRAANDLRKVVIHTLAIGEFQRGFMVDMAKENGGIFVDLGR